MADKAQQKAMYTCFARIGVKNSLRRRKEFSYEALMLLLAFLMTALLYILVQYPYFNVLGIYLGVYEMCIRDRPRTCFGYSFRKCFGTYASSI